MTTFSEFTLAAVQAAPVFFDRFHRESLRAHRAGSRTGSDYRCVRRDVVARLSVLRRQNALATLGRCSSRIPGERRRDPQPDN